MFSKESPATFRVRRNTDKLPRLLLKFEDTLTPKSKKLDHSSLLSKITTHLPFSPQESSLNMRKTVN